MSSEDESTHGWEDFYPDWKESQRRLSVTIDLAEDVDWDSPFYVDWCQNFRLARARVGTTARERAQWLLRFGTLDPGQLSAGDYMNWQWDLLVFEAAPEATAVTFQVDIDGCLDVDITAHLEWLRTGLACFTRQGDASGSDAGVWRFDVEVQYSLVWVNGRAVPQTTPRDPSSGGNRFKWLAYMLLTSGPTRVRQCRHCATLFIGRSRQRYCTSRCSQAVRDKEYRGKNMLKLRERRHDAYKRRVRSTLGANVKVSRREPRAAALHIAPRSTDADGHE